jgi:hypothetical protein
MHPCGDTSICKVFACDTVAYRIAGAVLGGSPILIGYWRC